VEGRSGENSVGGREAGRKGRGKQADGVLRW
jgi:hypothetical protein